MATTITETTSEMRWVAGADLSGATLTMWATRGAEAPVTVPVTLDPGDARVVIADVDSLTPGTYLIQLRAVRFGKTVFFPSAGGEELTITPAP